MTAPTLDGHANAGGFNQSSTTITLTTSNGNDVIVLVVGYENSQGGGGVLPTISSVTATGLTFTQRGTAHTGAWASNRSPNAMDVWWAPASAALTAKVITVTFDRTVDGFALVAFGVNGCNDINAPWDSNLAAPIFNIGGDGGTPVPTEPVITTAQANDFIFAAGFVNGNTGDAPSLTALDLKHQFGNNAFAFLDVGYETVSAVQAGATIAFANNTAGQQKAIRMADALTADAATVASTWVPLTMVS